MATQTTWNAIQPTIGADDRSGWSIEGLQPRALRCTPSPVSKAVSLSARSLESIALLSGVPAGEAKITVNELVERSHEVDDHRTYRAALIFPGRLLVRADVEIDVIRYSSQLATITVRSPKRLSRRLPEGRYLAAATAAVTSLERALRPEPGPTGEPVAPESTVAPVVESDQAEQAA